MAWWTRHQNGARVGRLALRGDADHPEDIGRLTAAIFPSARVSQPVVYIAGDTLTYRELADVMQAHWGVEVNRVLLNKERLQEEVLNHPRDVGAKYRLAFARPDGVALG